MRSSKSITLWRPGMKIKMKQHIQPYKLYAYNHHICIELHSELPVHISCRMRVNTSGMSRNHLYSSAVSAIFSKPRVFSSLQTTAGDRPLRNQGRLAGAMHRMQNAVAGSRMQSQLIGFQREHFRPNSFKSKIRSSLAKHS